MIPGDTIPALIDPADVPLAFEQNLAVAHAGPGLALLVIGLVIALACLVLVLGTFELRLLDEDRESDATAPLLQAKLLPACAADELAPFTMVETAMLEFVERHHAGL